MNVVAADMIGDTTIETAEIIIVESTLSNNRNCSLSSYVDNRNIYNIIGEAAISCKSSR